MSATDSEEEVEVVVIVENREKGKKKKYSKKDFESALSECVDKKSIYKASIKYNIPYNTLKRHVDGGQVCKTGRKLLLTVEDEATIAEWIIYCAAKGDPRTKAEVIAAATEFLMRIGKRSIEVPLSKGWFHNFMKRHPEISSRTPQLVTRSSACVTEEDIRRFHKKFVDWLEEEGLFHLASDPSRWLNADETGFELNPKPKKVLAAKGSKDVHHVERADPKKRVSVMYTFGADGSSYKPQIIASKSSTKIPDMLMAMNACKADFVITETESGYQTRDSFEAYVKESLVPEIDARGITRDANNPVFFFIDGHKSHNGIEFSLWCRENHIHLISFFPNATRILQMCDVAMFGPGKRGWSREVQVWRQDNRDKILDEVQFISILKKVNERFIKSETIKNGFRATGIHPLNVENIHFDRCIGTLQSAATTEIPVTSTIESVENIACRSKNTNEKVKALNEMITELLAEDNVDSEDKFHLKTALYHIMQLKDVSTISEKQSSTVIEASASQTTQVPSSSTVQVSSSSGASATFLASGSPVMAEVLPLPISFSRSTKKRAYKQSNYGVLTSDAFIENCQKVSAEQEQKELDKEQRRILMSIKKENNLKIQKDKKDAAVVRKIEVEKKKKEREDAAIAKKAENEKKQEDVENKQEDAEKKETRRVMKKPATKTAVKRKSSETQVNISPLKKTRYGLRKL